MQRVFIINIFLCWATLTHAQRSTGDSLLDLEYAYFKTTDEFKKQELLLKKIACYLKQNNTEGKVFSEVKRVKPEKINDNSQRSAYLWNATVIAYLNNETDYARFYMSEYIIQTKDSSVTCDLLYILVNKYTGIDAVNQKIEQLAQKDSLFRELTCFADIASYSRKHINRYLIASAILPGSGTMMNGYVLKGLISLALTAGSVYGVIKLIEYGLYINAVLWGTGVGLKFYTGNIKLTEQTFYKAEERKKNKLTTDCELKLKTILSKYPLTLREL
ncbi:MAG: hypothetical protein H0W61_05715 [Bacteroidetes bacterium]|nr:hypothetical protein [Bacteroidota bacterium]